MCNCMKTNITTVDQEGVACVGSEGVFLGWVLKSHQHHLTDKLRANEHVKGLFIRTETFYWLGGGGSCVRGEFLVL